MLLFWIIPRSIAAKWRKQKTEVRTSQVSIMSGYTLSADTVKAETAHPAQLFWHGLCTPPWSTSLTSAVKLVTGQPSLVKFSQWFWRKCRHPSRIYKKIILQALIFVAPWDFTRFNSAQREPGGLICCTILFSTPLSSDAISTEQQLASRAFFQKHYCIAS